jgi:hypothetical protein
VIAATEPTAAKRRSDSVYFLRRDLDALRSVPATQKLPQSHCKLNECRQALQNTHVAMEPLNGCDEVNRQSSLTGREV